MRGATWHPPDAAKYMTFQQRSGARCLPRTPPIMRLSPSLAHILGAVSLIACGGSGGSDIPADRPTSGGEVPGSEAPRGESPPNAPTPPKAELTGDPFPFVIATTNAEATDHECPQEGTNDRILLRAFSGPTPSLEGPALMLTIRRDAPIGSTIELMPEGPSGVPGAAFDARGREAGGNGVSLFVVQKGPAWPELDAATLSVQSLPLVDGENASARARVHFVDGRLLDVTVSGPLVTRIDPCGDTSLPEHD